MHSNIRFECNNNLLLTLHAMHAMNAGMSSTKSRHVIAIPADVSQDLREISKMLGSPTLAFVTRAGLKYVTKKIKAGEIALVNGELRPVQKAA